MQAAVILLLPVLLNTQGFELISGERKDFGKRGMFNEIQF